MCNMIIKFSPRISNAFIDVILKDPKVIEVLDDTDLEDDEVHAIAKQIVITAFSKYNININDLINYLKEGKTD